MLRYLKTFLEAFGGVAKLGNTGFPVARVRKSEDTGFLVARAFKPRYLNLKIQDFLSLGVPNLKRQCGIAVSDSRLRSFRLDGN